MTHPIHVGTCGWSYKDWVGHFYPTGTPAGEFLSHYSQRYNFVEVDSTFYASPARTMVEGWDRKTPPGFRFCLKVPQTITHEKCLLDCQAEVELFLTEARRLGKKLHCCLLQFGYFNTGAFSGLGAFLERLDPFLAMWPKEVPIAVEIRNKHWFTKKFADCLRSHNAVWALSDQSWMPPPLEVVQELDVVTGPFGYLRLIGDRAEVDRLTPTLNQTVIDRTGQIVADANTIRLLAERVPVLAFVNNHFAGYAHDTIERLLKELGTDPIPFQNPKECTKQGFLSGFDFPRG